MKANETVITRFAPSPTGTLHVGSARTALFNFLYAKKHGGKLLLRIEDTDKERSKGEFETDIKAGLQWLGITFDAEYKQSERAAVYTKYLSQLVESGHAYVSKEEPKKPGDRTEVIRFKNPNKKVTFRDLIRGDITVDTTDLGDFVIARDMHSPLYHLAVVVDDHEMGVTHIIRGDDGIANTPRQILIQEALGAKRPVYAHIPLILAPDRSKLSKRHGAISLLEYKKEGYLPQAMVNFLALLGWNPGGTEEIFSQEELIEKFSIERVQKGGAIFNPEKLDWVNREHIKLLSEDIILQEIQNALPADITKSPWFDETKLAKILPLITERINKWGDVKGLAEAGELTYFFTQPDYDTQSLSWKGKTSLVDTKEHIDNIIILLSNVAPEQYTHKNIKSVIWPYADEKGRGDVLWPMRYALSGRDKSPDPFMLAEILGKEEVIERLQAASRKLSNEL